MKTLKSAYSVGNRNRNEKKLYGNKVRSILGRGTIDKTEY